MDYYKNTIIVKFKISISINNSDNIWLFLSIVNYIMYKNFTK